VLSIDRLVESAALLGRALEARKRMIVTVESCTGGMIAMALTETPGSSAWFDRGLVTYTNAAKSDLVGVPAPVIARHGAVSVEVARAMACGALHRSPMAALAVSVTGIAGPGGATPSKPVGTVVHGFAWRPARHAPDAKGSAEGIEHQVLARHYPGDRGEVRLAAAMFALGQGLQLLREVISD